MEAIVNTRTILFSVLWIVDVTGTGMVEAPGFTVGWFQWALLVHQGSQARFFECASRTVLLRRQAARSRLVARGQERRFIRRAG